MVLACVREPGDQTPHWVMKLQKAFAVSNGMRAYLRETSVYVLASAAFAGTYEPILRSFSTRYTPKLSKEQLYTSVYKHIPSLHCPEN